MTTRNGGQDALTIVGVALAALVLTSVPPIVAVDSLLGGAFFGIVTWLGLWASGSTRAIGTWTWRAAAAATLIGLAVLSLADWLGPGSVLVLALAGIAVMTYLGWLILHRRYPSDPRQLS